MKTTIIVKGNINQPDKEIEFKTKELSKKFIDADMRRQKINNVYTHYYLFKSKTKKDETN